MDIVRFKEIAEESRKMRGLCPFREREWAHAFEDIPEGTGRYEVHIFAYSNDEDFLAALFGAGSDLNCWYNVRVCTLSEERQKHFRVSGRHVFWSEAKHHKTRDLLSSMFLDFKAGWVMSRRLSPLHIAEKKRQEAEVKEREETCEFILNHFYGLDYKDWDKEALVEVSFPKRKDMPGFYSMVRISKLVGEARRIRIKNPDSWDDPEGPHLHSHGKKVIGTIRPLEYARHLEIWMEHNPYDPANDLYSRVIEIIRWKMR